MTKTARWRARVVLALASLALACQGPTSAGRAIDVVIVGGGVAGLLTAYELEKRGVSVHLLEAQPTLGGRVATIEYAPGVRREAGLQELWEGNPLIAVARELGVPLDPPIGAYGSTVLDGTLHPHLHDSTDEHFASFLRPSEHEALQRWHRRAGRLVERAHRVGLADPEIARLQELSFADWIAEEGLPPRAVAWIDATLSCEMASEPHGYSALSGLIEFARFRSGDAQLFHVTGGNSRLVDALADAIRGPITRGARVSRIERFEREGTWRVRVAYVREGTVERIEARHGVSTVPFTHLHQIVFEPPLTDDQWTAIRSLGLGKYASVHFRVPRSATALWTRDGISMLAATSNGPLGVIYGPPDPLPPGEDDLVFSLLLYGSAARSFHLAPRADPMARLMEGVDAIFPGFAEAVKESHGYFFHPAGVAVWPPGRSPLDPLSAHLREPDRGLHFAGDWTEGSHSDGAARSALRVVEHITNPTANTARTGAP